MANSIPVGIIMPYNRGPLGYFEQTYSDIERALTNIKMLLMTAKGERPMMPTYGSDLRSLLFDPNTMEYGDHLFYDAVTEATELWMPEVDIHKVTAERNLDEQPNAVTLKIEFSLKNIPDSTQTFDLEVSL